MIATTYEAERSLPDDSKTNANFLRYHGAVVMHNVDAARLEKEFSSQKFNTIIFQFEDATEFSGFKPPESYPFDPSQSPGYSHVNTNDDESAIEEHKKFVTRVFRLKT
jgi:hypothetical protein